MATAAGAMVGLAAVLAPCCLTLKLVKTLQVGHFRRLRDRSLARRHRHRTTRNQITGFVWVSTTRAATIFPMLALGRDFTAMSPPTQERVDHLGFTLLDLAARAIGTTNSLIDGILIVTRPHVRLRTRHATRRRHRHVPLIKDFTAIRLVHTRGLVGARFATMLLASQRGALDHLPNKGAVGNNVVVLRRAAVLVATNMSIAARPLLVGFLLVAVDVVAGRQRLVTGTTRLATGVLARLLTLDVQHLATTLEGALGDGAHASLGAAVQHLRRRPRGRVNLRLRVAGITHTLGFRLHRRSRGLGMLRH